MLSYLKYITMKKAFNFCIGLALAGTLLTSCAGSYYVSERPVEPRYERPAAPYPNAVWVSGEWVWRGDRYVYRNGYWARPHNTRTWISGEWRQSPRGYVWVKGHWR